MGSSIAFVIHSVDRSFDPRWGLVARGLGVSIHLHESLSQSLFAPLIPLWGFARMEQGFYLDLTIKPNAHPTGQHNQNEGVKKGW